MRKNLLRGVVHAFQPVADHVVPHALGPNRHGQPRDWCGGCNYGKYHYTVEQIGIDDPRCRAPVMAEWGGFRALLPELIARPFHDSSVPFASRQNQPSCASRDFDEELGKFEKAAVAIAAGRSNQGIEILKSRC